MDVFQAKTKFNYLKLGNKCCVRQILYYVVYVSVAMLLELNLVFPHTLSLETD